MADRKFRASLPQRVATARKRLSLLKKRSTRLRSRQSAGSTERRSLRLLRVGMCGREPCPRTGSRMAWASQPRSATVSCRGNGGERRRRGPLVRNLLGDRHELDRQAAGADDNMDIAARPAPGAPNGGVRASFSARRVLASANDRAVDGWKRLWCLGAQGIENAHPAPFPDQRLQRLQAVVRCPHSSGRSRHGIPRGRFGGSGWITARSRSVRSQRDIAGTSRWRTRPRVSVPMCSFIPKCHRFPFLVRYISGSRALLPFPVDDGAEMMVASTMLPFFNPNSG